MVYHCAALNCTNTSDKNPYLMFHSFPINDELRLKKWIHAVRRNNFKPTKSTKLCSKHFCDSDYFSSLIEESRKRLKNDAVPSIFDFSKYILPKPKQMIRNVSEMSKDSSILRNETEFECGVCLQTYRSKKILKNHIKVFDHKISNPVPELLRAFLPSHYRVNSLSFKKISENSFNAKIVLPDVSDIPAIHSWVEEFSKLNKCIYSRRMVNKQTKSSKMIMREIYLCYYYGPGKGTGRKKNLKGTNCRSRITVALKNGSSKFAHVTINYVHNHSLETIKQRFSNPFSNLKEIFIQMFENGATALEALRNYQVHIETQVLNGVTRLQNPCDYKARDYDWMRHLFQKTCENKYSKAKFIELTSNIRAHMANINEHLNDQICFYEGIPNNFVILITTPIMKKTSKSEQARELFIDGIGNCNVHGLKVFLIMVLIEDIGLPVGILISSSESSEILSRGFRLFLNSNEKFKNISTLIVADKGVEITNALKSVFPNANQLLCPIYFLRQYHRWLIRNQNIITDRNIIFDKLREIVFAKDEITFNHLFDALKNTIVEKKVLRYLENIYVTREKWAFCYRNIQFLKNTFHVYLEHNIRLIRDQILDQIKLQILKSLINFIIFDFSDYFYNLCIDGYVNRSTLDDASYQNRQLIEKYDLTQTSNFRFTLFHKKKNLFYEVNTYLGVCTCSLGCMGAYCKHQKVITCTSSMINYAPKRNIPEQLRKFLRHIVTDELDAPSNSLHELEQNVNENIEVIEMTNEDVEHFEDDFIEIEVIEDDSGDSTIEKELTEFKQHISEICEKVLSSPNYFHHGLANLNRHLDIIKKNPDAILHTMLSVDSQFVFDTENDPN